MKRREVNGHTDVTYQISIILHLKMFVSIKAFSDALNNVVDRVKQHIHKIDKHPSYCAMTYDIAIPFFVKKLKKI